MVAVPLYASSYREGGPHALRLGDGLPVGLAGARLSLRVAMQYRVERAEGARGPWKVRTLAYSYVLHRHDGPELLAYHWHPGTAEAGHRVPFPHLHVNNPEAPRWVLGEAHLPTGRVALEDVLRLVIVELGAKPRCKDWRTVLTSTARRFADWRTWG